MSDEPVTDAELANWEALADDDRPWELVNKLKQMRAKRNFAATEANLKDYEFGNQLSRLEGEHDTAITAAALAQMELDCLAICMSCRKGRPLDGDTHVWNMGVWNSERIYENRMRCQAVNIRHAWAVAHPIRKEG